MPNCLRVLVVEDSEDDTLLMINELETAGFDVTYKRVDTADAMVDSLSAGAWDIILADYRMPNFTGNAALKLVRDHNQDIPFILVSGQIGEETAVEAMKAGAHDYVMKDNIARLAPAVERELREAEIRRKRRVADEALHKNEVRFRQIYDSAPVMMHSIDKNGVIRNLNRKWLAEMGYSRDEMIGRSIAEVMTPESIEASRRVLPNFWYNRELSGCSYQYIRKDGTIIDVILDSEVMDDPIWGEVSLSVVRDITAQKHAEEALKESEKRFRAIFESAQDCIFIRDSEFRFTHVNRTVEKLWGLPASKLIGLTPQDLYPPEQAMAIEGVNRRVLAGETIEWEHVLTVNGVDLKVHTILVPLQNSGGKISGICGISRDVSHLNQMEFPILEYVGPYQSKAMKATLNNANLAASGDSTVLLLGESGSGKDHLARYIHNHSKRADGKYFAVNCAAIVPQLAESELFGHERGAFTGAVGRKRGLLELAEGGTLLLNEIGELSLSLQSKLLTFLDTRTFTRVGGEKEITVNARLIAATNSDLAEEVAAKRFRQDLFYRINVMTIEVPPLRERLEDIPILVKEILQRLRGELQIHETPVITSAAIHALKRYAWPGNVRELRNVLERAMILSPGKELNLASLGLREVRDSSIQDRRACFSVSVPNHQSMSEISRDLKRFLIDEALRQSGGKRQGAARLLGISRDSLKHYMKSLDYYDR